MLHGRVHAAESVQSVIVKAVDLAALLSTCSCTEAFAFACCVVTMVMSISWKHLAWDFVKINETASAKSAKY